MRGGLFALFLGVTTVYARFSVMLTGFLTAFITFIYKPDGFNQRLAKKTAIRPKRARSMTGRRRGVAPHIEAPPPHPAAPTPPGAPPTPKPPPPPPPLLLDADVGLLAPSRLFRCSEIEIYRVSVSECE